MNTGYKSYSIDEALIRLQGYCSYQDRCHQEVRQKLKEMRMIPEAIDTIMASLIKDDYLNESRFANSYVRGKFKIKKWGRHRLISELKKKGLSKYTIKQAMDEINNDEYIDVFHDLAEKRVKSLTDSNLLKKKKKLADYLIYRGWESHLVYDKVNELIP